jgi:CheY-like chemotaxis protein
MRKVLIVEDDNKFRVLLRRLLEKKFRLQVFEAANGIEGIEIYKRESPNLIFLDISMPYMNGIEYLAKLRQEHEDLITPVVVLTCVNNKEAVQQMMKLGITDYVVKADFVIGLADRIYDILIKIKII